MEAALGDLLESEYMSSTQATWLREQVRRLLPIIREQSVPLTDSFNLSDHLLNSALGKHDGKVYETLYALAKADPLTRLPPVSPFSKSKL